MRFEDAEENLRMFYWFVTERQEIWYRRNILKLPREEWTNDEILKKYKFTNVYRILDPGTYYLFDHIFNKGSKKEQFFNVFVYRLFNRTETFGFIGFQTIDEYDKGKLLEKLTMMKNKGMKIFTSAFIVTGQKFAGSPYKYVNIVEVIDHVFRNLDDLYDEVTHADSMQECFEVISSVPGIGDFLGYQILLDLTYNKIVPFSEDGDWAVAGNGCKRGLRFIWPDLKAKDELDAMIFLRDNQFKYFEEFGLDFKFLHYYWKDYPIKRISLSNIENCCCEFSKYMKAKTGQGRPRVRFVPRSKPFKQAF